ncbi:MAG: hypothetical protein J2P48_17335 [Alphaproteobacteria bacterium]|nr:hypothetical protein [Alphaproteobacteria bacterium]
MSRNATLSLPAAGRGVLESAAPIGAFVIITAVWWWDSSLLMAAADKNLELIRTVTSALPFDWGTNTESGLRIFSRALLPFEGVGIAKVAMLGIAFLFRRCRQPRSKSFSTQGFG